MSDPLQADREFWILVRRALLAIAAAIKARWMGEDGGVESVAQAHGGTGKG